MKWEDEGYEYNEKISGGICINAVLEYEDN
ncbi:hypothetical protein C7954_1634 [Halanaerobium congolense]|jgi:hypothetical protein|uniref:Uncharacterized protein n=1 Tax=Halanaerobium congolense TaxID=54121 RepID=A0A1M7PML9_9FIRM|nr:hypothetical protein C8C78_1393 [Halanaerobium congolense]TDX35417.1 hypothetical protein C7954_1634 [Halanaerobium congolense]SHN18444.1 hypothetical protein SAMN04515650_14412 [Halanaerobium congolense]